MLSAKTALCLAGAAGGCCAIVVPVSLSTMGGSRILLTKCENSQNSNPVSLDQLLQGSYCWKLSTESGAQTSDGDSVENISTQHGTLLTNLLQSILNNNTNGYTNWDEKCENGSFKWKLEKQSSTGGGDSQNANSQSWIVGYCDNTTNSGESNTPFVEISQEQTSLKSLNVCSAGKECFSDSYDSSKVSTFKSKVQDKWKEVKFYSHEGLTKS